jgi:hypothetical protein
MRALGLGEFLEARRKQVSKFLEKRAQQVGKFLEARHKQVGDSSMKRALANKLNFSSA